MVVCPCYFYRYFVPTGHYVTTQVDRLKAEGLNSLVCLEKPDKIKAHKSNAKMIKTDRKALEFMV
ncbi:MAG: hypothetical protein HW390_584 [Candidatus Brocadiaceae bacterium]|nr:hypothetical protein [Candidatus Brocadiaceae bacterium]